MDVKEAFHNGFTFDKVYVEDTRGLDENDREVLKYKEVQVNYRNADGIRLCLFANPDIEEITDSESPVAQTAQIGGVTVSYHLDHYKFVPPDYQLSEAEKQWQEISEKMRTNMETCSKDAAEMAGDLYDYIKIATRERYDYKRFLQKFTTLREEIRLDLDSYDYIYYTYGLNHYGNMPLIEALEYKEVRKIEELAIVIDTSESCSGEYVRRFLEETFAILTNKDNFFRKMNVHIIQCDAKAQQDDVITSEEDMKRYMENFKLIGFGGTDFRPAFEYVNELCRKKVFRHLKGLLYFTDGYGTYPARRPDYDVAFVFLEESYNDRHVPPWAIKLILGPEDIQMGGLDHEH